MPTSESTCDQTCSASPTTTASACSRASLGSTEGMNSANTTVLPAARYPVRDLVGAAGLDGHGGDADQIDTGVVEANVVSQMLCTIDTSWLAGVSAAKS